MSPCLCSALLAPMLVAGFTHLVGIECAGWALSRQTPPAHEVAAQELEQLPGPGLAALQAVLAATAAGGFRTAHGPVLQRTLGKPCLWSLPMQISGETVGLPVDASSVQLVGHTLVPSSSLLPICRCHSIPAEAIAAPPPPASAR